MEAREADVPFCIWGGAALVQGIGETLVIGRDRQKRRSRTFTQLPQAEKYLARMGFKAAP